LLRPFSGIPAAVSRCWWDRKSDEWSAVSHRRVDANGRLDLVRAEPQSGGQVRPELRRMCGPSEWLVSDLDDFAALRPDRCRP
jgi:hypothetical protein